MGISDFKLKWGHAMNRGKPMFISSSKILVASDFFMRTINVSGQQLLHHFKPGLRIGSCCSLPQLGIVAVSERKGNSVISILKYPDMSIVSTLEQISNIEYAALQFMGLEFLLSLQLRKGLEFDLWRWSSGERVHYISIPLLEAEIPNVEMLPNPLWWHQIMVQSNTRLISIEVKKFDENYHLHANSNLFYKDKKDEIEFYRKNHCDIEKNFQTDVIHPQLSTLSILCFCWLPESFILVATSAGIFKFGYEEITIRKLANKKVGISSMTLSRSGLFVGYSTGYIDIVNMSNNGWNDVETINVGQPIIYCDMSPNYEFLIITTLKGSIILNENIDGRLNTKFHWKAEFGGDIGVGFTGPVPTFCAVVKKNGFIHIFRTADGSIVSSFQIDEEISAMATSSLCSLVVVGTNVGFLYFIDCTDPSKPKIVSCEQPYDIPIDNIKFENFGRFIVTSAQNQDVKIWKGTPSTKFVFLGSKTVSVYVKDLAIFSMTLAGETFILLLTVAESGSKEDSGSILIRLKLPSDFISSFKNYHIDLFGTLNGDALNFQKRKLDNSPRKIEIHSKSGAVFFSPSQNIINTCSMGTDFVNAKQNKLITMKHISDMSISQNHLLLAVSDRMCNIHLYSFKDVSITTLSKTYMASENVGNCFIDVSVSSNNLVCGRENCGTILCYEWSDNSSSLQTIPEWVAHCSLNFRNENHYLKSMDEEDHVEVTAYDTELKYDPYVYLSEIFQQLELEVSVVGFKLDQIVDSIDLNQEVPLPSNFTIEDGIVQKLCLENRCKISNVMPASPEGKPDKETEQECTTVKDLTSINSDYFAQNYSIGDVQSDITLAERLTLNSKKLANVTSTSALSRCVKMKCKEERISAIRNFMHMICKLKTSFNDEFDALMDKKAKISDFLDEAYYETKMLSLSLPSKAERDFWNASIERSYSKSDTTKPENTSEELAKSENDDKSENDAVQETKSSIESQICSTREIQERFDSDFEILLLKKRYCDFHVYHMEAKIYIMLLIISVENEFSNWRNEAEKDITDFEKLLKDVCHLLKDITDLSKRMTETFQEYQKMERKFSSKVESKCAISQISKAAMLELKKQLPFKLSNSSQNPFFSPTFSINVDDISPILEDFRSRNPAPSGVEKSNWEKICNGQIQALTFGIILRNLQTQVTTLTHSKLLLEDVDLETRKDTKSIRNAVKLVSELISTFTVKFQSLLTILEEIPSFKVDLDLKNIPSVDNQVWKTFDGETFRMKIIVEQLKEMENLFDGINKLKKDMHLKADCKKSKGIDLIQNVQKTLGDEKRSYSATKCAAKEHEAHKNNMFKVLKSVFQS